MFTRIVVPIDESLLATKALPYAIGLAQKFDASLLLVQAVEGEPATGHSPQPEEPAHAHLVALRHAIIHCANHLHLPPEFVRTRVVYGERNAALVEAIHEEQADLVVMTTHGRAGLPLLALGSVAAHIVQHSPVPVVLIRPETGATPQPIEVLLNPLPADAADSPVLVALDGTEESETILEPALYIAKMLGAPMALIHVIPSVYPPNGLGIYGPFTEPLGYAAQRRAADTYLRRLQFRINERGVPCRYAITEGNPVEQITGYAHTVGAQYIAMMAHPRARLAHVVLSSTSEGVVRRSHLPVLLLHPVDAPVAGAVV